MRPPRPTDQPTRRELEIIRLLAQGYSNARIGRVLWLSTDTVKTHLRHAFERFGVANRAALVAHAIRQGWI